jgi:hypothetical protein
LRRALGEAAQPRTVDPRADPAVPQALNAALQRNEAPCVPPVAPSNRPWTA